MTVTSNSNTPGPPKKIHPRALLPLRPSPLLCICTNQDHRCLYTLRPPLSFCWTTAAPCRCLVLRLCCTLGSVRSLGIVCPCQCWPWQTPHSTSIHPNAIDFFTFYFFNTKQTRWWDTQWWRMHCCAPRLVAYKYVVCSHEAKGHNIMATCAFLVSWAQTLRTLKLDMIRDRNLKSLFNRWHTISNTVMKYCVAIAQVKRMWPTSASVMEIVSFASCCSTCLSVFLFTHCCNLIITSLRSLDVLLRCTKGRRASPSH